MKENTPFFLTVDEYDRPLELAYNWGKVEPYNGGKNFGYVAYEVDKLYDFLRN